MAAASSSSVRTPIDTNADSERQLKANWSLFKIGSLAVGAKIAACASFLATQCS
jgi:hypothetical protein